MALHRIATRVFGVPLLIERGKMDVILAAMGPRLGVSGEVAEGAEIYGPGDTAKNRKPYYITEDKIAVIDVVGPLVKRNSGSFMSGGPTTYGEVENEFMDAATDPEVKGILLQIDSPGGESVGAFELSDLIYSQRGSKPIFAAADGDAFSAAFALASAADRVFVTKSGGVGSVGVWMLHVDWSAWNEKAGVKPTYIFAGGHKVDGNPDEPLSKGARSEFQGEIDRIYGMFVETIARNRGMDAKAVSGTEARLFFGQNGVDVGFADQVGTFSDALAGLRAAIASPVKTRVPAEEPESPDEPMAPESKTEIQSSGVAVSAAPRLTEVVPMDEPKDKADAKEATAPGGEAKVEVKTETPTEPKPTNQMDGVIAEAKTAALTYAAEVAEFCSLAGMPSKIAGFLREVKPLDEVRKELQAARVAADAETEIHSAVLPETGADNPRGAQPKTNADNSPIVKAAEKAAERFAAARKER